MKNMRKRILAMLLCVLLCASLLPAYAFADGTIEADEERSGVIEAAEEEIEQGTITAAEEGEQMAMNSSGGWDIYRGENPRGRLTAHLSRKRTQNNSLQKGSIRAENSEDEEIDFSTFEELKSLAEKSYSSSKYARCLATEDFTIAEDLSLPENLEVYFYDCAVSIPTGVTLTTNSKSMLIACNLVVDGIVNNYGGLHGGDIEWDNGVISYKGELTVNGTINNHGTVDYPDEIVGLENIVSYDDSYVLIEVPIDGDSALESMISMAENDTVASHYYDGYARQPDLTIATSHVMAYDCSFFVRNTNVTIAETATVTLTGNNGDDSYLCVDRGGKLTLSGKLINNGFIEVYDANEVYGKSRFECLTDGDYRGRGTLGIEAQTENEIFTSFLTGFDAGSFRDAFLDNGLWILTLKTDTIRIYGQNRYQTGLKIGEALKGIKRSSFPAVVVAFGGNFPDALAGSYLASKVGAPILLINDKFANDICSFIRENMVSNGTIYILGGTGVVSASVENKLKNISKNVIRLEGAGRYETNLAILREAGVSAGEEILVCIGTNYADSLSVSSTGKAILLVRKDGLTAVQKEFLSEIGGNMFTILGGPGVITEAVEEELKVYGNVERVYGASRYETSTKIAERYFPNAECMVIAVGNNFPDGLSVGPLAYALNAPLVLTLNGGNSAAATAYAETLAPKEGVAIGGSGLLSDQTVMTIFGLVSADEILIYN